MWMKLWNHSSHHASPQDGVGGVMLSGQKITSVFNEYINRPPVCSRSLCPPMMPCSAVFTVFKWEQRLQSPFSLQNRPQTVSLRPPAACWEHTFILSFISRPRPLHKEKASSSSSWLQIHSLALFLSCEWKSARLRQEAVASVGL